MDNIKTIAILALVAMLLALCAGMMGTANTASETVQQFAPIPRATADIALDRRRQEAQITAEYIAVLATEVYSDTQVTHALIRRTEQEQHERDRAFAETMTTVKQMAAWAVGTITVTTAAVFVVTAIVILVCAAYERYKRARVFEPYQVMPDRALLFPGWQIHIDPRTGLQTGIKTEHLAQLNHGQLLIERQLASHKPGLVENVGNTVTQAMGAISRYRVRVRNGERHPETGREIVEQ